MYGIGTVVMYPHEVQSTTQRHSGSIPAIEQLITFVKGALDARIMKKNPFKNPVCGLGIIYGVSVLKFRSELKSHISQRRKANKSINKFPLYNTHTNIKGIFERLKTNIS